MKFLSSFLIFFSILGFFGVESRGEPSIEQQNIRTDVLETSIEKTKAGLLQQSILKRLTEIGDFNATQKGKLSQILSGNNSFSAALNELRTFILQNPNLTSDQKNKVLETINKEINSPISSVPGSTHTPDRGTGASSPPLKSDQEFKEGGSSFREKGFTGATFGRFFDWMKKLSQEGKERLKLSDFKAGSFSGREKLPASSPLPQPPLSDTTPDQEKDSQNGANPGTGAGESGDSPLPRENENSPRETDKTPTSPTGAPSMPDSEAQQPSIDDGGATPTTPPKSDQEFKEGGSSFREKGFTGATFGRFFDWMKKLSQEGKERLKLSDFKAGSFSGREKLPASSPLPQPPLSDTTLDQEKDSQNGANPGTGAGESGDSPLPTENENSPRETDTTPTSPTGTPSMRDSETEQPSIDDGAETPTTPTLNTDVIKDVVTDLTTTTLSTVSAATQTDISTQLATAAAATAVDTSAATEVPFVPGGPTSVA